MKFLVTLAMAVAGGIAIHQTRPIIDHYFENEANKSLASYGIGVLAIVPYSLLLHEDLKEIQDDGKRHVLAVLLSSIFLGIGVVTGYVLGEMGK